MGVEDGDVVTPKFLRTVLELLDDLLDLVLRLGDLVGHVQRAESSRSAKNLILGVLCKISTVEELLEPVASVVLLEEVAAFLVDSDLVGVVGHLGDLHDRPEAVVPHTCRHLRLRHISTLTLDGIRVILGQNARRSGTEGHILSLAVVLALTVDLCVVGLAVDGDDLEGVLVL